MPSIFLSHTPQDLPFARILAAHLRSRGAQVFLDEQPLSPGEDILGRLGDEIEQSDHFVLLLSPSSAQAQSIHLQLAWAIRCDKPITPVMLEPASLIDLLFLVDQEAIDFSKSALNRKIETALDELAAALELPELEGERQTLPDWPPYKYDDEDEIEESAFTIPPDLLSELYITAADLDQKDLDQAMFIYRLIYNLDEDYMVGKVKAFLNAKEKEWRKSWPDKLLVQAETALDAGHWRLAARRALDVQEMQGFLLRASDIVNLCHKLLEYEPDYETAILAAESGKWNAVTTLLRDIREKCPQFGDPANLVRGKPVEANLAECLRVIASLKGHRKAVNAVAFSPDGKILASAGEDQNIILWSVPEGIELAVLKGHQKAIHALDFSPDGTILASSAGGALAGDNTIRLWQLPDGKELHTLVGHDDRVSSLKFSPDGSTLASASSDRTVRLWQASDGKQISQFEGHTDFVRNVSFSPDGKFLASCGDDWRVMMWDVSNQNEILSLSGHAAPVRDVTFSPDGKILASASLDGTIVLWDFPIGRELFTLEGHRGGALSLAFSPKSDLLISGGRDGFLKIWDVNNHTEVSSHRGHLSDLTSVAFSPDGIFIATSSIDKTVRIWGLG